MRFNVKNLGFIKSGFFETNDLTIIFGKNNSGKTYLSYAAYIIAQEIKSNLSIFGSSGLKIEDKLSSLKEAVSINLEIDDLFKKGNLTTANILMRSTFARNFNVRDDYFAKTEINFDFDVLYKKAMSASFSLMLSNSFSESKIFISKEKDSKIINLTSLENTDAMFEAAYARPSLEAIKAINNYFYNYQVPSAIIDKIMDVDIKNPFVITSERTGVEMFYKEIDNNRSSITENLTITTLAKRNQKRKIKELDEITESQLSKYSKPISDNIKTIRNQQEIRKTQSGISKEKNFKNLADTLRMITKGKFKTNSLGDTSYVMDGHEKNEIPLHAASSSIKSMTMIDLYINHIASPGDTLIIDEPELNLHPDNQILMAELIIRLINTGIKVIMTTHSDYLIREINNRIKLFSANKKNKYYNELSDGEFDIIENSRVNVFNISPDGEIEQINVSKYGIDDVIFDDVIINSVEREDIITSLIED
ncbi:AAA family ATPase [Yersinia enterocolitica]|uniref:AAA family ATPase n=1 Tax=Yersinia enterocolitica TaxID=630 RepID=UPI003F527D84